MPLRRPDLRARVHLADVYLVGWSVCGKSRDVLGRLDLGGRVDGVGDGGVGRFLYFRLRSAWRRCTRAVITRCMVVERKRSASWRRDMVVLMIFANDVVALFRTGASSLLRISSLVILILRYRSRGAFVWVSLVFVCLERYAVWSFAKLVR